MEEEEEEEEEGEEQQQGSGWWWWWRRRRRKRRRRFRLGSSRGGDDGAKEEVAAKQKRAKVGGRGHPGNRDLRDRGLCGVGAVGEDCGADDGRGVLRREGRKAAASRGGVTTRIGVLPRADAAMGGGDSGRGAQAAAAQRSTHHGLGAAVAFLVVVGVGVLEERHRSEPGLRTQAKQRQGRKRNQQSDITGTLRGGSS